MKRFVLIALAVCAVISLGFNGYLCGQLSQTNTTATNLVIKTDELTGRLASLEENLTGESIKVAKLGINDDSETEENEVKIREIIVVRQ